VKFKPTPVVADLKLAHFDQLVVARAKKIPVVVTAKVGWIVLNPQHDVVVDT
jgi:hypothetical protein